MDLIEEPRPSYLERHPEVLRQVGFIVLLVISLALYRSVAPVTVLLDKALNPVVNGIVVLYGKMSSFLYYKTGFDLGFVTPALDPDFLFRVRLATYVKEKKPALLLDMASDGTLSRPQREEALKALLRFDSSSDWIQSFLNELPKGGLLGLYEPQAALLDELVKRVRLEGGIEAPLVRDYAEVVFSFLIQLPDAVVRRHGYEWMGSLIPQNQLYLIANRIDKERDPDTQKAIEEALWAIHLVPNPQKARSLLVPFYRNPPWDSLRDPLTVVLARLGYDESRKRLASMAVKDYFTEKHREAIILALSGKPFASKLPPRRELPEVVQRRNAREAQYRLALQRQKRIDREEREQAQLAMATEEVKIEEPELLEKVIDPEELPQVIRPKKAAPPPAPRKEVRKPAEKQVALKPLPNVIDRKITEQVLAPPVSPEKVESKLDTYLPEEPVPKRPKSNMNYVDIIFEVKKFDVPLYKNPGGNDEPLGSLPVGTRGKADFEIVMGVDRWYQVKSKKGNGWVNGSFLTVYNLNPEEPSALSDASKSGPAHARASQDVTYFKASQPDIPVFQTPSESAARSGTLQEDRPYQAIKSEKVGPDRWFLLQIEPGAQGWVRGIDIQLAEESIQKIVQQEERRPEPPASKSAFSAEWIVASVKGVGVYSRPSIVGKIIEQISPPTIYRVLEAASGNEWYRIQLGNTKEGWVQALDVRLTKPGAEAQ